MLAGGVRVIQFLLRIAITLDAGRARGAVRGSVGLQKLVRCIAAMRAAAASKCVAK